jgi:REP element-mobilizing transposase RayT
MSQFERNYSKYGAPFDPGEFYHIYNKAVRNDTLFYDERNYRYFLNKFHLYTREVLSVYSFCLLNNHFHFLIKIDENINSQTVSEQLRKFFISYSKSFNKQQNRKGTLFEKHLKRVRIDSEEQLLWTIYYIHRNPVHHGITQNYQRYRWSSYPVILSKKETNLKRKEVLSLFSGKEEFIEFHQRNIREDVLSKKISFQEIEEA